MMTHAKFILPIVLVLSVQVLHSLVAASQCGSNGFVYGENEIIDQLMTCSMAKSSDFDLTPQGDYVKKTAKALIEQGLSNKTSILYARLNGLWTAKRSGLLDSAWSCKENSTTVSSIIELSGLSLEVVEKVDIPLHRSQHKLAIHKPCKTFELPLWMCRQSKPIYRSTKTWVNRAYLNLTLTQQNGLKKPEIDKLSLIFTCPETFKQKITYSPAAMYILSRFVHAPETSQPYSSQDSVPKSVSPKKKRSAPKQVSASSDRDDTQPLTHPVTYATTQDGKSLASPPYHTSVNLIIKQVNEQLRSSLTDCIQLLDSDLSLMVDYSSFNQYKYRNIASNSDNEKANEQKNKRSIENECSSKTWLKNRIDLANQAEARIASNSNEYGSESESHAKRSQYLLNYPVDPNQLLNPYGYYHDNVDQMVEDS